MLKIEEMYAFVSVDQDGNEGVCAFNSPTMGWVPMVGADMERIESLRKIARKMYKSGTKIKLLKFTTKEVLEEWK